MKAQYFWMPKDNVPDDVPLEECVAWFWDTGEDTPEHGPFKTKADAKRDRRRFLSKGTGPSESKG